MRFGQQRTLLLCLLAGLVLASPACASTAWATDFSEKDSLAIGRLIGLLENTPKDAVAIAVVIHGAASEANGKSFLEHIGKGKRIGNTLITAYAITPEQLASTPAQVVLIPDGIDASMFDSIFSVARKRQLVTISNSTQCLDAQRCAIWIKTDPAVDIRMSALAARQTGVSFSTNFHMMIKEVP